MSATARLCSGIGSGRGLATGTTIRNRMAHVHVRTAAAQRRSRLAVAMALSVAILVVGLAAAWESHSLALLADAAHVFADVSGMALSLGAIWLASRPTNEVRSYGLYRVEI